MTVETPVAATAQDGKFLSFVLGEQEYGLEILKVQEIAGTAGITNVPQTPDCVRGVLNLRGRVIPIVSLRQKFRMPVIADDEKTCVVVVDVKHQDHELTMGIVVDEVTEVLNIKGREIDPAPSYGSGRSAAGFITGTGLVGDKAVVLMDIDRVLDHTEIEAVIRTVN